MTSFADYVIEWKEHCRVNVSEGWRMTQDRMLENHILPYIGKLQLNKITPQHISIIMTAGVNKGHKPATLKQTYLLLSKIFNDALHFFEYLEKSPIRKRFHSPKVQRVEAEFLSHEDAEKLMEHAKYHWCIQAIVIQIFIGLRAGEVIALRWRDVDFENNLLNIRSKWNKKTKKIDDFTKNKKQVLRPFAGRVRSFLIDLKETMQPSENDFVCPGPDAKKMMSYHSYQKAIVYLCEGAKIKRISSHAFRHTCSTIWVREGATTDDIKLLLNHEHINSTKTYMHDDLFRLKELASRVMKLKVAK